jgi:hypothetical protein
VQFLPSTAQVSPARLDFHPHCAVSTAHRHDLTPAPPDFSPHHPPHARAGTLPPRTAASPHAHRSTFTSI